MEHLTDKNFEETIKNSKTPVLIDFWAEWCPPCKKLLPVLEIIEKEYKNKLTIYKINVDENPILGQSFKIEVIPTVILLKNNETVAGFTGFREVEDIKTWLSKNI